jgi:pimeloyl-ACP methyl ester carboxylesterase
VRRRRSGHGDDRGARLIELHVEEHGDGFPLLLIQGLGWAKWASGRQWADFARRRRVLAFDNRGTGLSAKPPGPYSMELLADDAASVLDARGIEQADVYGHSMGGYIALQLSLRRPELVRSLVLVGTGPGGPDHLPPPAETLVVWKAAYELSGEEAVRMSLPMTFPPGWAEEHPSEFDRWVAARLDPPTPRERWLDQVRAVDGYKDVGVEVERIGVPALVIHGELDRVVPVSNGRLLAARLPRAELVLLPNCGHAPMLEEPGPFGELVCSFLDRVETNSA